MIHENEETYESIGVTKPPYTEEPVDQRPVVLFVGIEVQAFSSVAMIKAWNDLGYRVEFINWQLIKMQIGFEGMWGRVLGKAAMINPDIIFLHIQNEDAINVENIIRLQKIAPVINYSLDCRTYAKTLWLYDLSQNISLTCCSNEDDAIQCIIRGANAIHVPSSADYDFYKPRKSELKSVKISYPDIVFVGGRFDNTNTGFEKAHERQEMIDFLYENYPTQFSAIGMGQKESRYVHQNEDEEFFKFKKKKKTAHSHSKNVTQILS